MEQECLWGVVRNEVGYRYSVRVVEGVKSFLLAPMDLQTSISHDLKWRSQSVRLDWYTIMASVHFNLRGYLINLLIRTT